MKHLKIKGARNYLYKTIGYCFRTKVRRALILRKLYATWLWPPLHLTFKFAIKRLIELITFWSECRYVANCARCPDKINCRRCKPRYFKIKISASHNSTCVVSCPRGFAKKGRRCQRITEGNQSFNLFCMQQWLKVLNNFNFYLALVTEQDVMAWKRGRDGFSRSSLYNCSHVEAAAAQDILSITSRVDIFEKRPIPVLIPIRVETDT